MWKDRWVGRVLTQLLPERMHGGVFIVAVVTPCERGRMTIAIYIGQIKPVAVLINTVVGNLIHRRADRCVKVVAVISAGC